MKIIKNNNLKRIMVRDGTCGVTADVLIKCWFWLVGLVGKKMIVTISSV